jgi:class 3 adenylate cyclase
LDDPQIVIPPVELQDFVFRPPAFHGVVSHAGAPATPSERLALTAPRPAGRTAVGSAPGGRTEILSVMFVDMVNYTDRVRTQSRAHTREMILEYREIAQPVFDRHSGTILQIYGDGILATFRSATQALLAGTEIQKLASESHTQMPSSHRAPISLRVGIATGEVVLEETFQFGAAVNLAARLQSCAAPGEVLFCETTRLSLNAAEVSYSEVGYMQIKGAGEHPVRVFRGTITERHPTG